jgi:hypothetical protein
MAANCSGSRPKADQPSAPSPLIFLHAMADDFMIEQTPNLALQASA